MGEGKAAWEQCGGGEARGKGGGERVRCGQGGVRGQLNTSTAWQLGAGCCLAGVAGGGEREEEEEGEHQAPRVTLCFTPMTS